MLRGLQATCEFSIEISDEGKIVTSGLLTISDTNRFITNLSCQNSDEYKEKYKKMYKGCVNFQDPSIVISFGIISDDRSFKVKNILSSLDWKELIDFLKTKVKIETFSGDGRLTYDEFYRS